MIVVRQFVPVIIAGIGMLSIVYGYDIELYFSGEKPADPKPPPKTLTGLKT